MYSKEKNIPHMIGLKKVTPFCSVKNQCVCVTISRNPINNTQEMCSSKVPYLLYHDRIFHVVALVFFFYFPRYCSWQHVCFNNTTI